MNRNIFGLRNRVTIKSYFTNTQLCEKFLSIRLQKWKLLLPLKLKRKFHILFHTEKGQYRRPDIAEFANTAEFC